MIKEDRSYIVTMTVSVPYRCDYTDKMKVQVTTEDIEIYAQNAAEAVKKARQNYRNEEGRYAPKATFKARRS